VLRASSGCSRLLCGSQGDESEADDGDSGEAEQITAQVVVLNPLHDHDTVVSERGPASEQNEAAMLARIAGGDQQEDPERDVDAEDHLVLPVDRRCGAVPERAGERVKAGQANPDKTNSILRARSRIMRILHLLFSELFGVTFQRYLA
jgi:hypothetical protein